MKRFVVAGCAVLAAGIAVLAFRTSDEPLASVADREIHYDDFRQAYVDHLAATGLPDTPRRRYDHLERLIGVQLVIADARRAEVDKRADVAAAIAYATEKLKVDYFVQQSVLDTIAISDRDLRAMFLRMNTQVRARHLYAETSEEARSFKARLDAGETFESLAQEAFDDPELASSGGDLGYFGFDEMDPAFEDAAFALEIGQISDLVRTSHGYSILRVEDRQPKPLITEMEYASAKPRIRRYVEYRRNVYARKALVQSLLAELDPQYYDAGFEILSGLVTGNVRLEGETPSAQMLSEPLVTFGADERRTWTLGDFRERAEHTRPEQRESVTSAARLKQFVDGLLVRESMLSKFERDGWSRDPEFISAVRDKEDELIYEAAYRGMAADVTVSPDSVRAYHRRYAPDADFEGVAAEIEQQLVQLERRSAIRDRVARLREEYPVVVHAEDLGKLDLRRAPMTGQKPADAVGS